MTANEIPNRDARWAANLLHLSRYCPHAACRRAHRCRGDARRCIPLYTHLVPEHDFRSAKAIIGAHKIREDYAQRIGGAGQTG